MAEVIIWFLMGVPTILERLEKAWNLQMPSSMPGKGVMELCEITESFGKFMKFDCAPYKPAELACSTLKHLIYTITTSRASNNATGT